MKTCTKCKINNWNGNRNTSFCSSCYKEYMKNWRNNNKERINKQRKENFKLLTEEEKMLFKQKTRIQHKEFYIKNKEKIKNKVKIWRKKNRDKLNSAIRNKRKKPHHKFRKNLSDRIRMAVKADGTKKSNKTEKLIGCTIEYLRGYMESKFKPGMTWENYGKWHIDHIIPCASFDLSIEENQYKCFHYTNLQPLWALENISKGSKILDT